MMFSQLRRWMENHTIGSVILLCMLFVAVVILTFGGLVLLDTRAQLEQEVAHSELKMLAEASDKLDLLLSEIRGISDTAYINRDIKQILAENDHSSAERSAVYDEFLSGVRNIFPWLGYEIYLFDLEGFSTRYSVRSSPSTNLTWEDMVATGTLEWVLENGGQKLWVNGDSIDPARFGSDYFLMNTIFDNSYSKPAGISVITFKKKYISRIYDFNDPNASVTIIDGEGRYVSGTALPELDLDLGSITAAAGTQDFIEVEADGQRTLLLYHKVNNADLYLVELIPASSLFKQSNRLWGLLLLFLLLTAVSTGIFYTYVLAGIYRPINRLLRAMKQVQDGDLQPGELDIERRDEIGRVNRGFVRMVEQLQGMFHQVEFEQENKRRAEIQMLQAQINPHFLHNTISSIRFTIDLGNVDIAKQMLSALVQNLKVMLQFDQDFITLEEELRNVRAYLFIQNCRFHNFEVDYQVDKWAYGCLVPRLLLQPIVENCVQHGFLSMESGGEIRVAASVEDDCLVLLVEDNGIGISKEDLAEIMAGLYQPSVQSIGLKNITQRLGLLYPGQGVMEITNRPGGGLRVLIRMPYVQGV